MILTTMNNTDTLNNSSNADEHTHSTNNTRNETNMHHVSRTCTTSGVVSQSAKVAE